MPFIKQLNKDFFIKDNHFELSPDYLKDSWKFKKITGTRLGSVLGLNKYTSPLKVWCMMVGIYTEPMDPTLAKLGMYIEPKVRDYVSQKLNVKFKDYVPSEVKWDVFKKVDDVFGGIPDGEPINQDGTVDYSTGNPMLEIKTTSIDSFVYKTEKGLLHMQKEEDGTPKVKIEGGKKLSWYDNNGKFIIPNEYMYQLGLYLYLRKINKGAFAVCFLKKEDYAHPENFKIEDHEIVIKQMSLNGGIEKLKPTLDKAREWYHKHIKTGISPEITEADRKWLREVELLK